MSFPPVMNQGRTGCATYRYDGHARRRSPLYVFVRRSGSGPVCYEPGLSSSMSRHSVAAQLTQVTPPQTSHARAGGTGRTAVTTVEPTETESTTQTKTGASHTWQFVGCCLVAIINHSFRRQPPAAAALPVAGHPPFNYRFRRPDPWTSHRPRTSDKRPVQDHFPKNAVHQGDGETLTLPEWHSVPFRPETLAGAAIASAWRSFLRQLQRAGDLASLPRWQVARALERPSIRVKSLATPGRPLHLDNVVQRHPRGQQSDQRMPASTMF